MKCKYLLISILALASCSKEASVVKELPDLPSEAIQEAKLKVSVLTEQTSKVDNFLESFDYEDKINNIQILVFDSESGSLNYYKDLGKSTTGSFALYMGKKLIYALANGPSLADISSLEDLEELTYSMKDYNTTGGMIMLAQKDITLDDDMEETLYLDRMAARIYVSTVNNKLPAAYSTIKIQSVMLGNVSSLINPYGDCVATAPLINPAGVLDNPVYDFTYKEVNKNAVIGTTCSVAAPLYCFINEKIDKNGTFVSLKIEIDGESYYYTVYLDPNDLGMNSTSDIHLNVIGLGTKDPSEVLEKRSLEYEIEVREWQFASAYTETL